jgi:hypothetical protein
MVHITSQFFVLAALIASSCALNLSKRSTAADVEADLKNISTQITTLDNAINSFPSTCSLILALVRCLELLMSNIHDWLCNRRPFIAMRLHWSVLSTRRPPTPMSVLRHIFLPLADRQFLPGRQPHSIIRRWWGGFYYPGSGNPAYYHWCAQWDCLPEVRIRFVSRTRCKQNSCGRPSELEQGYVCLGGWADCCCSCTFAFLKKNTLS